MEINYDCMEHICEYADKDTLVSMMSVSKKMNAISSRLIKFHKFHSEYKKAIMKYIGNRKKAVMKKRMLYKVMDIIIQNQDTWRFIDNDGGEYDTYCKTIQYNVRHYLSLEYVPLSRRQKYMEKLEMWEIEAIKKYKITDVIM